MDFGASSRSVRPTFAAASAASLPPQGTLFRYGPAAANVAFLSGRHPRHVVLVGGLTDGLLFAPYVRPLAAKLEERRWSLVQTLLSSSHTGYGCASLDQDAEELHRLACHLRAEYGSQVGDGGVQRGSKWVLVGHVTRAAGLLALLRCQTCSPICLCTRLPLGADC